MTMDHQIAIHEATPADAPTIAALLAAHRLGTGGEELVAALLAASQVPGYGDLGRLPAQIVSMYIFPAL